MQTAQMSRPFPNSRYCLLLSRWGEKAPILKKGHKTFTFVSLVCSKSVQETTAHLAGIYHFTGGTINF